MGQIILMSLGTLLGLCFVFMALKGKKYDTYIQNLNGKDYPLYEIYVVGFFWAETRILRLRGKFGKELRQQSRLIYGEKYGEYYAQLHWAQAIALIHLIVTVVLLLAAFTEKQDSFLMVLAGGMIAAAAGGYYLTQMKNQLKKRKDDCEIELPNMISKLALLINSGMVLREAWNFTAYGSEGRLYELMQKSCEEMKNGKSEIDALYQFGMWCSSPVIKKFANAMIQGIEKGNSELAEFLSNQSAEMWAYKKQLMLQKGEVAASKLVAPIGIMFAGVLLIVISAALSGMSL